MDKSRRSIILVHSVKGGFVDIADPTSIDNQDQIKAWAEANPDGSKSRSTDTM